MSLSLYRNSKLLITRNIDSYGNVYLGNEIDSASTTLSIVSASFSNGVLTVQTATPHLISVFTGLVARYRFSIQGIDTLNYNGTWEVANVVNSTTVTATKIGGTAPSNGSATIISGSVIKLAHFHIPNLTQELQIKELSFSQSSAVETASPNTSGNTPIRGVRQFISSIDPVEFSFTTYVRPRKSSNVVTCDEEILWNVLTGTDDANVNYVSFSQGQITSFSVNAVGRATLVGTNLTNIPPVGTVVGIAGIKKDSLTTGGFTSSEKELISKHWNSAAKVISSSSTSIVLEYLVQPAIVNANINSNISSLSISLKKSSFVENEDFSYIHFGNSDISTPKEFGMLVISDNVMYAIDGCVLDIVSISISPDSISSITWSGKAKKSRQLSAEALTTNQYSLAFSSNLYGIANRYSPDGKYVANAFSTMVLKNNIGGLNGQAYNIPVISANITITNSIETITSNTVYEVSRPVAFFNKNRSISGNIKAYLRSGTIIKNNVVLEQSSTLRNNLLNEASTTIDPKYYMEISIGAASSVPKLVFDMQAVTLEIPNLEYQEVLSMEIGFRAQASKPVYSSNADYAIENKNELCVRYYSN